MSRPRKRNLARFKKKLRVKPHRISKWITNNSRTVGIWFLILGFLLTTFPPIYKKSKNKTNTTAVASIAEKNAEDIGPIRIDSQLLGNFFPSQSPLRIVVPKQNIDLSIVEAPVVNGYWELSETTASHGVGSANPGEIGNTVIFAHAREKLFLPLRNIKNNESIYILTKDRWFRYVVLSTHLVDANQIETIAQTPDETLTLFTCSGFLDTKRLIVVAKPLRP